MDFCCAWQLDILSDAGGNQPISGLIGYTQSTRGGTLTWLLYFITLHSACCSQFSNLSPFADQDWGTLVTNPGQQNLVLVWRDYVSYNCGKQVCFVPGREDWLTIFIVVCSLRLIHFDYLLSWWWGLLFYTPTLLFNFFVLIAFCLLSIDKNTLVLLFITNREINTLDISINPIC
jgi:hypothetical protein